MNRTTLLRAAATVLVAGTVSTGCSSTAGADAAQDVVMIVTPTSNASALLATDLDPLLQLLDGTGDRVVVVSADGAPSVEVDFTVGELPGNSGERNAKLSDLRLTVADAVLQVAATDDEVDLSEGIALGAEAFRAGTAHTMAVFASGLQTTGALSLLEGRLYAEPSDLVTHVEQNGGLPDLSTVDVRMPKFAVTSAPQAALPEGARSALTAIWREYFARAGAESVELATANLVSQPVTAAELPYVTPVPVERPQPSPTVACRQSLGDDAVGFAARSADLADPDAVRALLARTVGDLAGCQGSYVVEGSASSDGEADGNLVLSTDRAQAVAEMLAEVAHVSIDDIRIVGWGENWPCRVPDVGADGELLLDGAIHNRSVVVSKGETSC